MTYVAVIKLVNQESSGKLLSRLRECAFSGGEADRARALEALGGILNSPLQYGELVLGFENIRADGIEPYHQISNCAWTNGTCPNLVNRNQYEVAMDRAGPPFSSSPTARSNAQFLLNSSALRSEAVARDAYFGGYDLQSLHEIRLRRLALARQADRVPPAATMKKKPRYKLNAHHSRPVPLP